MPAKGCQFRMLSVATCPFLFCSMSRVASTVALNVTYSICVWLVPPPQPSVWLSFFQSRGCLDARLKTKQKRTEPNKTNQNKNTTHNVQQVRFSICVILLSVVVFYEYITTPTTPCTHTHAHMCTAAISFIWLQPRFELHASMFL